MYQYSNEFTVKLNKLKELDKRAHLPAEVFAYSFGISGALIFGTGMCLAMKIIGNLMLLGVIVGLIGIVMVSANYFLQKVIFENSKQKYAQEIILLSDELLNKNHKKV